MKNTICNIITSIVSTNDPKFVETKIHLMEQQLKLNEVEKSILKDIKNNLFMSNVLSIDFINEKYSYYVESDENILPSILSKDAIDSAIIEIRVKQLKAELSKQMLSMGSQINDLTPEEIKQKVSELHTNVLVESNQTMPVNDLMPMSDAYATLAKEKDGMALILDPIEKHAGKAIKGSIVSILAFTGSFKSTYALNVAYKNAMAGHNCLYLALEDTGTKITSRLVINYIAEKAVAKEEAINSQYLRDQTLNEKQVEKYNKAHNKMIEELNDHLIIWDSTKINYQTFMDMTNTLRMADKQFKEKTGKGLDAIFVDQLSLLKYTVGSGKKFSYDGAVLNDWVSYFREQALNFLSDARQIVVFLVAQTSRDSYNLATNNKNNYGYYDASCSSDSHEIERSSSTMITLFKSHKADDTLLICVPKARNGQTTSSPISVESYGNYFHVGSLNCVAKYDVSADSFSTEDTLIDDYL
jgi:hypothetical protein